MSTIPVNLAVEDQLSEAVLRRVLSHLNRGYAIGAVYNRGGYGYLKRTVRGWNTAAVGIPFLVLTDLDEEYPCPSALIREWLPVPQHHNLLFRVAVREVEAWLLADRVNLASFLGISEKLVPSGIESLVDPKRALINLARSSRFKDIRERLVPKHSSTARQGRDYNGCLTEFVNGRWDIGTASERCPSLFRTVEKLRKFVPVWPDK
jgi:hypothetical protein